MGSEGVEDQRRHTVATSQNGCLKAWNGSRGTHGITLNVEHWYDVRQERLIITPDGTAREKHIQFFNLHKSKINAGLDNFTFEPLVPECGIINIFGSYKVQKREDNLSRKIMDMVVPGKRRRSGLDGDGSTTTGKI